MQKSNDTGLLALSLELSIATAPAGEPVIVFGHECAFLTSRASSLGRCDSSGLSVNFVHLVTHLLTLLFLRFISFDHVVQLDSFHLLWV